MSSGGIYLVDGESLVELTEVPYESESLLQRLLAEHPKLLAGDQLDSGDPRRWVLVQRELAVPDRDDVTGRW